MHVLDPVVGSAVRGSAVRALASATSCVSSVG